MSFRDVIERMLRREPLILRPSLFQIAALRRGEPALRELELQRRRPSVSVPATLRSDVIRRGVIITSTPSRAPSVLGDLYPRRTAFEAEYMGTFTDESPPVPSAAELARQIRRRIREMERTRWLRTPLVRFRCDCELCERNREAVAQLGSAGTPEALTWAQDRARQGPADEPVKRVKHPRRKGQSLDEWLAEAEAILAEGSDGPE